MPPRLRTLPERHGGRVVLGLLIAILALGLGLRAAGRAEPRPRTSATTPTAYMAIAEAPLHGRPLRRRRSRRSPNDWSPGRAAALRAASTSSPAACTSRRRCCCVALLGTGTILLTYLLGRRLGGPVAGLVARAAGRDLPGVHREQRAAARRAGRAVLAARGDARVPVGLRRRPPVALAGARRAARAHHAHPARSTCRSWPLFALLALARVWLGAPRAACCGGVAAAALLVAAFCAVLAPWTVAQRDRARPLRAGHHGRRQGAVRRHLPARRRPPAARQAPADRALLRQEGPPLHGGRCRPRWRRCSTGSRRSTRSCGRDAALARIGRENFAQVRRPSSRSTTPGW